MLLTIGELSRRTNVAVSALRYYDELGLLRPHARVSGRRHYTEDAVDAVGRIRFLSDLHFTLREIAELARADSGAWRTLAQRKIAELDRLVADAGAARIALDHALQCPHEDLGDCPTFWEIVRRHQAGEPLAAAHEREHTAT